MRRTLPQTRLAAVPLLTCLVAGIAMCAPACTSAPAEGPAPDAAAAVDAGSVVPLGPKPTVGKSCGADSVPYRDMRVCERIECINGAWTLKQVADFQPCDDGNVCTLEDKCQFGSCKSDTTAPNSSPCLPPLDKPCLGKGKCLYGKCRSDPLPKGTACSGPAGGCVEGGECSGFSGNCEAKHKPEGAPCTFVGIVAACETAEGTCSGTQCKPAKAVDGTPCDGGDRGKPCFGPGACASAKCVHPPLADGTKCADPDPNKPCLAAPECAAAKCVNVPVPDGKPCGGGGHPCIGGASCVAGKCNASANNGLPCDDGDECSFLDQCKDGACAGTPLPKCDDDNDCTLDTCNGATGTCDHQPVKGDSPCDDGVACTVSNVCSGGKCTFAAWICPCIPKVLAGTPYFAPAGNKKCPEYQVPGNACSGRMYCDTTEELWKCKLLPGSVGGPCDGGDGCLVSKCDDNPFSPTAGQCVPTPTKKGTACGDGDVCTSAGQCDGKGSCAGQQKICPCTPETVATDCAFISGGDKCIKAYCDTSGPPEKWTCKKDEKASTHCFDGDDTPCRQNVCDKKTGACQVKPINEGKVCNDGYDCTANERCFKGVCAVADPQKQEQNLLDANPDNDFDATGGQGLIICPCKADADCVAAAEGDRCKGTLSCDPTTKKCRHDPVSQVFCSSAGDTQCARNVCWPKSGKCELTPLSQIRAATIAVPDAPPIAVLTPYPYVVHAHVPCDDGVACTNGDRCEGIVCAPGPAGVGCGCKQDADCVADDDGNACNGVVVCMTDGQCALNPATVANCDQQPKSECTKVGCDPKTGKCVEAALPPMTKCSDGVVCEGMIGKCVGGACKVVGKCSCAKDLECLPDDGLPGLVRCGGTHYCDPKDGECRLNTAKQLDCSGQDTGPCTVGKCDPATQLCTLQQRPDGTVCDDNSPCTSFACCSAGKCVHTIKPCPCAKNADCAKYDHDKCIGALACDQTTGQCVALPSKKVVCSGVGKGQCLEQRCNPLTGTCQELPKPLYTKCDDGSSCTFNDHCVDGNCLAIGACFCSKDADCASYNTNPCAGKHQCKAGKCIPDQKTAIQCPHVDSKDCKVNVCDPASGGCKLVPGPSCSDGNPCTIDTCAKAGNCNHEAIADGTECDGGRVCQAGKCVQALPGMAMVPAGTSMVGCPDGAAGCKSDTLPQHKATTSAFWLDRFEVRAVEYAACVKAGACKATPPDVGCGQEGNFQPAVCVKPSDAEAYCAWRKKRLPTEAEWERAMRGPCINATLCPNKALLYLWHGKATPTCKHAIHNDDGKLTCSKKPGLIGSRMHSDIGPHGHYDLAGNVREWVADGYSATFYKSALASGLDAKAPKGSERVVRGGGWNSTGVALQIHYRGKAPETSYSDDIGFRCAQGVK